MAIQWHDAAHTQLEDLPEAPPEPQLTCGFIIESNEHHTNIATNVSYDADTGTLVPVDGFVIPDAAIISTRKIGDYDA